MKSIILESSHSRGGGIIFKQMKTTSQKDKQIRELRQIPGVGISIANDLINIGITSIDDLKNKDPEWLYHLSNKYASGVQDRCLLYVFRCAVYYASKTKPTKEKLKWWNWKDK